MPTLENAHISFTTETQGHDPEPNSGGNKDFNTNVTVDVFDGNGTVVARTSNEFGNFPAPSNNGPFALSVLDKTADKDRLAAGKVRVHIDPVGNDTWLFNTFVDLAFSDGSSLTCEAQNVTLSETSRDLEMELS